MTTPHWTPETKMLVRRHIASAAAAIHGATDDQSPYDISIERAERLLTALADAGLLLPDGTQTRTEWGVRYPNLHQEPVNFTTHYAPPGDEHNARRTAGATEVQPGRVVVHRRVHTEPWQPAPDRPEAP
jgi:hypothetical protein